MLSERGSRAIATGIVCGCLAGTIGTVILASLGLSGAVPLLLLASGVGLLSALLAAWAG